jgi:hypothetical protein
MARWCGSKSTSHLPISVDLHQESDFKSNKVVAKKSAAVTNELLDI